MKFHSFPTLALPISLKTALGWNPPTRGPCLFLTPFLSIFKLLLPSTLPTEIPQSAGNTRTHTWRLSRCQETFGDLARTVKHRAAGPGSGQQFTQSGTDRLLTDPSSSTTQPGTTLSPRLEFCDMETNPRDQITQGAARPALCTVTTLHLVFRSGLEAEE